MPVWVHTGHQPNATPTLMGALARDFPEAKLIIGHMGSGMFYDAMCMAKRHPNLYIDISLQGGHAFERRVRRGGRAGSCIYGSDSPYANPGSMKRIIDESPLSSGRQGAGPRAKTSRGC